MLDWIKGLFKDGKKKAIGFAIDELTLLQAPLADQIKAEQAKIATMSPDTLAQWAIGKAQDLLRKKFNIPTGGAQ